MIFSHDHGHFFPNGPGWTEESLMNHIGHAHELRYPPAGLDPVELDRVATAVAGLSRDALGGVLGKLVPEWLVTQQEAETLGFFIEHRASEVATRLRAKTAGAP